MKATGIIRKIDELGRIVIPKEIRKTMRIKTGEALEIFIEKTGEVVLKKYDPMSEQKSQIQNYVESLSKETGTLVLVTDNKEVIAAYGKNSKEVINEEISIQLERILEKRNIWFSENANTIKLTKNGENLNMNGQIIAPIISNSDLVGSIIMVLEDKNRMLNMVEQKAIQIARTFLAKQLD